MYRGYFLYIAADLFFHHARHLCKLLFIQQLASADLVTFFGRSATTQKEDCSNCAFVGTTCRVLRYQRKAATT